MLHGWIILDKPVGLGSTSAVSAVKRILREAGEPKTKIGHGGTLDPLASGVLPIALGEATKLAGRMLDATKAYDFTITFGAETDTLDAEGTIVATRDIAHALNTVGHVTMLRRTRAGPFSLEQAISLDFLAEAAKARALTRTVLPLTAALDDIPALPVTPDQARLLRHGQMLFGIPAKPGLSLAISEGTPVALVEALADGLRVVRGFNLLDEQE